MVNQARRRFLVRSVFALLGALGFASGFASSVSAKKGKDDLHDLDESSGGRGKDIDDRRQRDEGGRGDDSDRSGRHGGRPRDDDLDDDGDPVDIAKNELESEGGGRRRYSDPLRLDSERF